MEIGTQYDYGRRVLCTVLGFRIVFKEINLDFITEKCNITINSYHDKLR